jgi:hypothetical protein
MAGLVVGGADLLGAQPGDFDLDVSFVGGPRVLEPGALALGQVLFAGAQDVPDPIERVVLAAAVTVEFLLDTAPDVVGDLGGEFDGSSQSRV